MRIFPDVLLTLLLPTLILLHLYISPYTKVEESFNLQASHDILYFGVPTKDISAYLRANYDHVTFPGAVPRTFVGALILAAACKPAISLGIEPQLAVRAMLGLATALSLLLYRSAITHVYGRATSNWFLILLCSQFHIIYYASRTLPNIFAFILTTLALRTFLLPPHTLLPTLTRSLRLSLYLLILAGVIFRSEIALLLFSHLLLTLYQYPPSFFLRLIPPSLLSFVIALLLSVPLDTLLWNRPASSPLWPELASLHYNVILGSSSLWGVSPPLFYFTSSLPRLLLNPLTYTLLLPTALFTPATRLPALRLLSPSLLFIALYSLQAHKEWRFIIYTLPPITTAASLGATYIWTRRSKSAVYRYLALLLLASTLATFLISTAMLAISSLNYPGATALLHLHHLTDGTQSVVRLHMDTLTCTTGVTRFLQQPKSASLSDKLIHNTSYQYDKSEDPAILSNPLFWLTLDYALVEDPSLPIGNWQLLHVVHGFSRITLGKDASLHPLFGDHSSPHGILASILRAYRQLEIWARTHVTRGRWVGIEMRPMIRIMQRIKTVHD